MVKVSGFPTIYKTVLNNLFQVNSAFEKLPGELRIHVLLELTDYTSLRSLVRASPAYHASYLRAGREKFL